MSLVPGLTVAENILLGRWPQQHRWGVPTVDHGAIRRTAGAMLDLLEVKLNLDELVFRLSVAEQQLVEIAKALAFNPHVLILDEPTSALPGDEVDVLHRVVRRLAAQGMAVIYVTHRLQEIPQVADSVTVFRDGSEAGTIPVAQATPERIAHMMIGADWQRRGSNGQQQDHAGEVKLSVRGLTRAGVLHDISFEVRAGEVLGIAGLFGPGRTELLPRHLRPRPHRRRRDRGQRAGGATPHTDAHEDARRRPVAGRSQAAGIDPPVYGAAQPDPGQPQPNRPTAGSCRRVVNGRWPKR